MSLIDTSLIPMQFLQLLSPFVIKLALESTSLVVCEKKGPDKSAYFEVDLICPEDSRLTVASAVYGRSVPDRAACPFGRDHKEETSCRADVTDRINNEYLEP